MNYPVEVKNLYKTYRRGWLGGREKEQAVLQDITLSLAEQEVLGLVGESGCGKTTLAKIILGLEEYQAGSVRVNGLELKELSKAEFRTLRRSLQVVFQDPYSSLDPRMSVRQMIYEPWDIHGLHMQRGKRQEALQALLESVGLDPALAERYPHEFSGGQRQRIAIARALALEPQILVADEPVSALDVSVQAQILNLLQDIRRNRRVSMLFISHDFAVARFLCDRIAVMYQGRILELGPAEELLRNPQHPYTEALLSAVPVPDPALQKTREPVSAAARAAVQSPCPYAPRCQYFEEAACGKPFGLSACAAGHQCACARLPFKTQKSRYAV